MPAISTSYISQAVADGGALLKAIADLDIHRIELD